MPAAFFSFLSPSTLILTLPILFQNLAARNLMTRSLYFHYTAFLTPFVFVSAIYGFRNFVNLITKVLKWNQETARSAAIFTLLTASLLTTGVSEIHTLSEFKRKDNEHLSHVRDFLKHIPTDVSVRTHEFFAPHVSNRLELHIYENGHPKEGGSEKALNSDLVIVDEYLLKTEITKKLQEIEQRGYQIIHEHDGFYVFQKPDKKKVLNDAR